MLEGKKTDAVRLYGIRILATTSLLALAACGGGGGGGDSQPGGGGGGGGGGGNPDPPSVPLVQGATVGALELPRPETSSFLLRGTLPLPAGVFPAANGKIPLGVLDWDGTPVAAQMEIVSRHADASRGADVAEIIARVNADPSVAPGQHVQYQVVVAEHDELAPPPQDTVNSLLDGPWNVPPVVQDLLKQKSSILITAEDVFGHVYVHDPIKGTVVRRMEKHGDVMAQLRTYGTMKPTVSVAGQNGTIPHMFGVHAYVSVWSNEELVGLDLRFNNGADGFVTSTKVDDPLGKFYFKSINVLVPNGWALQQMFDDPNFGTPSVLGEYTVFPLVEPEPGNKLHVMPSNAQFHRRLMLSPIAKQTRARRMLDQEGLAMCRDGFNGQSERYWSWWNAETANYLPQRHRLPSLEHVGRESLREDLSSDFEFVLGFMEQGTGYGLYPVKSGVLGWAHPYGVGNGGMTGGDEIHFYSGVDVADSVSIDGYRLHMLVHRMHSDRMPNAYFDIYGNSSSVEQWLRVNGNGEQYLPMNFYMSLANGNDPMGYDDVDTFQVNAVAAQGRKPNYEDELLTYAHHDMQHMIRYTRNPKVLVWIGNDSLSRDDIVHQAEMVHLTYVEQPNSQFGAHYDASLGWDRNYVDQRPHTGYPTGRQEGWGLDTMNAAYSIQPAAWRASKRVWFDALTDLVVDGQIPCSGFIAAVVYSKLLDGKYRGRRSFEQSIMEHALRGTMQSVYKGVDGARMSMLRDVLEGLFYGMISPLAWSADKHAPHFQSAVAPLDLNAPVYCNSVPPDGLSEMLDSFQLWSSLGYAWEMTGDNAFLQKASHMIGGPLLASMLADGVDNLENRAALLAALQE